MQAATFQLGGSDHAIHNSGTSTGPLIGSESGQKQVPDSNGFGLEQQDTIIRHSGFASTLEGETFEKPKDYKHGTSSSVSVMPQSESNKQVSSTELVGTLNKALQHFGSAKYRVSVNQIS